MKPSKIDPRLNFESNAKITEGHCSSCQAKFTHSAGPTSKPVSGDVSLCYLCGAISIFIDDKELRAATPEEEAEYSSDPNIARVRHAIREVIKRQPRH